MRWRASAEPGRRSTSPFATSRSTRLVRPAGRDHGVVGELAGRAGVRSAGAPQRGEHVEVALVQAVPTVDGDELVGQERGDAVQPADHALRRRVEFGALAAPLGLDPRDAIGGGIHGLENILPVR